MKCITSVIGATFVQDYHYCSTHFFQLTKNHKAIELWQTLKPLNSQNGAEKTNFKNLRTCLTCRENKIESFHLSQ